MAQSRLSPLQLSLVTLAIAAIGGTLGLLIEVLSDPGRLSGDLTVMAFLGAALGGGLNTWAFGRTGRKGWAIALFGALLATSIGGAAAGSWFYPGEGTLMGLLVVYVLFLELPALFVIWLGGMIGTHLMARRFRGAVSS